MFPIRATPFTATGICPPSFAGLDSVRQVKRAPRFSIMLQVSSAVVFTKFERVDNFWSMPYYLHSVGAAPACKK